MTGKKILLTGARGFIGARCLPLLVAQGFEVVATARGTGHDVLPGVVWQNLDLLDPSAVRDVLVREKPTHLVHCAWHPVHGDVMTSSLNEDWRGASLGLVKAFYAAGGRRAALVGTCAEYDWGFGVCRAGETPHKPSSAYGAAKNALRADVEAFAAGNDLSFIWLRPFFMYGPGEHPSRLVASVIGSLLDGEVAETTHGRQVRDYLHVDDVARGIVAGLVSGYDGVIDLAGGRETALRDIVLEIARQLDCENLVRLGARPAREGEPERILGDPRPAFEQIAWRPEFELREGIADTIRVMRAGRQSRDLGFDRDIKSLTG